MKRRLEFLWARVGSIQVADMANNFFLVRFSEEEDYTTAAFRGPWKIYDYYIAVSQWSPAFNEEEQIKSILTWVRLPKLPIHYFNSVAVSRIGNFIGKTVRLDLATKEGSRCRYARVRVEIDLTKPLLGKYMIEDKVFKIEYESLENVCFDCGVYGHKKETCTELLQKQPSQEAVMEPPVSVPEVEELDTGEWMTVQRRNRRRPAKPGQHVQNPKVKDPRPSAFQTEVVNPVVNTTTVERPNSSSSKAPSEIPATEFAKFKEALDAAMAKQFPPKDTDKVEMPKVSPPPERASLDDITNTDLPPHVRLPVSKIVTKSKAVDLGPNQDDKAVPVTVVYHNPTFQAPSPLPRSSRSKMTTVRKGNDPKAKENTSIPAILGQKKRNFKKTPLDPSTQGASSRSAGAVKNDASVPRKPPDQS
ncbi:hypothetical protein LINPERHAP1_LOCUS19619 [Linum perenne]